MATTNGTLVFYNSWLSMLGKGADLSTDTFKIGLLTSSYTPSASTHTVIGDVSAAEVAVTGYARQTLGSVTYTESGGVATFNCADPVFSASGADIVARYYFIYDYTVGTYPLVCYGLLDSTPNDVTTTDGNTLTLNIDASGLFTLSVAA